MWLFNWIKALIEKKFVVQAREFSEFLGRLGFVAQLLTWLKPHLAPLFAWSAVADAGAGWEASGYCHLDPALYSGGNGE